MNFIIYRQCDVSLPPPFIVIPRGIIIPLNFYCLFLGISVPVLRLLGLGRCFVFFHLFLLFVIICNVVSFFFLGPRFLRVFSGRCFIFFLPFYFFFLSPFVTLFFFFFRSSIL